MKKLVAILFVFQSFVGFSQKVLRGQALSDAGVAIGVQVMNLVNEKTAESNGNGYFDIEANVGDMIVFPAKQYEYKRYVITADNYSSGVFSVTLIAKPEQLDEVVVNRTIMPEELGIPAGKLKYTPAERRLRAAKSSITESLINAITGRTKYLKKGVETEKKEMAIERLSVWFPMEYYVEKLKIPEDYVEGFWYYAAEDPKLIQAVKGNNKTLTKFELSRLSVEYQDVIKDVVKNLEAEPKQ